MPSSMQAAQAPELNSGTSLGLPLQPTTLQPPTQLPTEGSVNPLYRISSDEAAQVSPLLHSLPSPAEGGTPQGRVTSLASPPPFALPAAVSSMPAPSHGIQDHPSRHERASIGQTVQSEFLAVVPETTGTVHGQRLGTAGQHGSVLSRPALGGATQPSTLELGAICGSNSRSSSPDANTVPGHTLQANVPGTSESAQSQMPGTSALFGGAAPAAVASSASAMQLFASTVQPDGVSSAPSGPVLGRTMQPNMASASQSPGSTAQVGATSITSMAPTFTGASAAIPGSGTSALALSRGSQSQAAIASGGSQAPLFGVGTASSGSTAALFGSSMFTNASATSNGATASLFGSTAFANAASSKSEAPLFGTIKDASAASGVQGVPLLGSVACGSSVASKLGSPDHGNLPELRALPAMTGEKALGPSCADADASGTEASRSQEASGSQDPGVTCPASSCPILPSYQLLGSHLTSACSLGRCRWGRQNVESEDEFYATVYWGVLAFSVPLGSPPLPCFGACLSLARTPCR
jgi:hypothetical protein